MRNRDSGRDDDLRCQQALDEYRALKRAEEAIEDKYLMRLSEPPEVVSRQRVDDLTARLAAAVPGNSDYVREAWHLWRAKDPQPETHALCREDEVAALEKNLAFAALLALRSSPATRARLLAGLDDPADP